MYQHSFEKLNVWQDSIDLVELIYNTVKTFPDDEKFGISSQMKRCSVSISSNLAEGTSRTSNKDKARFSTIAFSSTMELLCQIILCQRLGFINNNEYSILREKVLKISNQINALKKYQLNT
ncbi:four helix bundle protein [Winogradskyella thalassocola]|jgi:four helix bundle protein|uniref:Four helix bundle protein n=1 Tax=Winogradskyella thalassocola TaxID=262004 RepID=A0A1G8HW16_9FLAO|nr:four helix bundle protein [Winogradskyella thalassocola]SDI10846.1 four helix bundle protein [Winogradskyella thalassocola]